ncbi:MAG: hypothetical protein IT368_17665 [Candidatus Hydrogenedentes bacterium]|nr:hypothetical protein [Candidatus Hydrogenedentota bacterium]
MGAANLTMKSLSQVLAVLGTLQNLYQSGQSAEQALRNAIDKTRKDLGVSYTTVRDACTRGLGMGVDEFRDLAERYVQGDPTALLKAIQQRTQDIQVHAMVQEILNVKPVAFGLGAIGLSLTATKDVPGTVAMTFRVTENQAQHLRAIAKRERKDISALLHNIVRDYIQQRTQEELSEQFSHLSPDEQQQLLKALQEQISRPPAAPADKPPTPGMHHPPAEKPRTRSSRPKPKPAAKVKSKPTARPAAKPKARAKAKPKSTRR